jgi:hypothetical protein
MNLRWALVTLAAAVAVVTTGTLAQRADQRPLENFDVRTEKNAAAAAYLARFAAPSIGAAEAAGVARLRADFPGIDVVNSPELGTPEVVSARPGTGFLTTPSPDRAGAMRAFLATYADTYGLTPPQVQSLELIADYENPAGNMAWVEFEQRINGLPVFRGLIRGGFTSNGELARTTGPLASGLDATTLPVSPAMTAAHAVALSAANVGWSVSEGALAQKLDAGGHITFARGPMADDAHAWLLYFPIAPGVARLAWATEIWGDADAYLILLDADDGTLLFRKNLTEYQTQSATYVIYQNDSPAPWSPTTAVPGSNAQAPFIARTLLTLIGNEAPNGFNNLGWMTDNTNGANGWTDGNNVQAGIDRDGTNGVDVAIAGVGRVFNFAYNPQTDEALTAPYQGGEVTDMFYWTNVYHDRLYLLGFTEAARNFQNDNFGRGGSALDRISAEAQDSSGTNNANFSTPSDGSRGRMQMYLFPNPAPDRSSGLEHDVLIHELTHGTSNRLHGNASGLGATLSRGMGEGWSDFYARALLSSADEDPNSIYTTGGWVTNLFTTGYTDNYFYGIRRFPYAVKSTVGANGKPYNPLTFADIDDTQINVSDGAFPRGPIGSSSGFEVHNIGEVWCMALLEVRARFITRLGWATGNQRVLQFITDGMKLDPVNPTLLQGRDSIVAAANAGGGTTADLIDIWAGFAARGMGFSARVLNASAGVVVEAFDLPGIGGASSTLLTESIPNGALDPGEVVTVSLCAGNNGFATSGNVTGTLLATGGVQSPSGAQAYGAVAVGGTVCRTYTFTVGATCGATLTATLQADESGASGRALTYSFQVGAPATPFFSQNFDGVTAPALPGGWTTSTLTGLANLWVTNATSADSAPNRAFAGDPSTTSDNVLVSPAIAVPASGARLTFRHLFNTEDGWDGGVLEIAIGGGAFQDIVTAGGSFVTGGYTGTVFVSSALRSGWTGLSPGGTYLTTSVNLPAAAGGQTVVLRWRMVSDTNTAGVGWSVDTIALSGFQCGSVPTPQITTPTPGSVLTSSAATFQWTEGTGVSQFVLWVGTTAGANDLVVQDQGTNLSGTLTGLPVDGRTLYVRLWFLIGTWQSNDYTYTAATLANITSPAAGSTLPASSVTFQWTAAAGASQYYLWLGSTGAGSNDLFSLDRGTNLSAGVTGLPANGSTLYVRLWSLIGGTWRSNDYTYTTANLARMTSPAQGSALPASSVTFQWTAATAATQYYLWLGSTGAGSNNLLNVDRGTNLNAAVAGLPTDGSALYVRLWSLIGGMWQSNDYTYTAVNLARMTSPAQASAFTNSTITFTWSAATGASQYYLWVGSSSGASDLASQDRGTNLSSTVAGLPVDGRALFVRLWSLISGVWQSNDYTYTAANTAAMTSPTQGATLPPSTVTFQWAAGTSVSQYYLWVGTTGEGSSDLDNLDRGTNLAGIVTNLPTSGGATIYVRLWSLVNGTWLSRDYTYSAAALFR